MLGKVTPALRLEDDTAVQGKRHTNGEGIERRGEAERERLSKRQKLRLGGLIWKEE